MGLQLHTGHQHFLLQPTVSHHPLTRGGRGDLVRCSSSRYPPPPPRRRDLLWCSPSRYPHPPSSTLQLHEHLILILGRGGREWGGVVCHLLEPGEGSVFCDPLGL